MHRPKILIFAGSTRTDSYNKKLARLTEKILGAYPVLITYLDLRDLPMPLYDGDLEAQQGIPENAMKFRELLKSHEGFLMACPEYNSSISGVLKNSIDWASRPIPNEKDLVCFTGKVVNLVSASPGKWGGMRGLVTVRSILSNIGSIVMPNQFCLPAADKAFKEDGSLVDANMQKFLEASCKEFAEMLIKLA